MKAVGTRGSTFKSQQHQHEKKQTKTTEKREVAQVSPEVFLLVTVRNLIVLGPTPGYMARALSWAIR